MTAPQEPGERTRWQRLHDDVADAAPHLGLLDRRMRPTTVDIDSVLVLAAQRDLVAAYENAQDEASAMALAGNPRRADYIEHMARRLIR
jgi:hypothetical protein